MKAVVISAYPCCGKSYCYEKLKKQYVMLDSDSSQFSWITRKPTQEEVEAYAKRLKDEGKTFLIGTDYVVKQYADSEIRERNPEFPANYIKHVQEYINEVDIIFVSSHLEVRKALQEAEIEYVTVYPDPDLIEEWVGRMYLRKSPEAFIKFQIEKWEEFTKGVDNEPHGKYVHRLKPRQYLSDVIDDIVATCHDTSTGIRDVIVPDPRKE